MLDKLKTVAYMLKFAANINTNTRYVFKFHDLILKQATPAIKAEYAAILLEDPLAARLYAERTPDLLYKPFDIGQLRRCAPGTLGATYAATMDQAGFDPEFFAYRPVTDPLTFFILRLRKTHDLYHVVTGFDVSDSGENALQGFYLGQLASVIPLSIVACNYIWAMQKNDRHLIRSMLDGFVTGYPLGKASAQLHGVAWERYWDSDLTLLRTQLGVKGIF